MKTPREVCPCISRSPRHWCVILRRAFDRWRETSAGKRHGKELGIAVGTLRKTLAELESRGLLERIQGSGNYIRAINNDPQSVYALFRLELIEGGGLPTAEILSVSLETKDPSLLPSAGHCRGIAFAACERLGQGCRHRGDLARRFPMSIRSCQKICPNRSTSITARD